MEEENIANWAAIADKIRRGAQLRETVRANTVEQPANDRAIHSGERVSVWHDRWHITEGFYDTALNEADDV
ncbi:hypothetical protein [Neorhodopirellula lusitana]|uniref:hypothetical protein n=1 Tax=Neorhodopirellula lusitana TaxID=445327 RepID=UPI0024B7848B|nr:hypothetical protein [Neorhodopirellula lusitana]